MLRQNRWEKEWMILEKKELRYLERQRSGYWHDGA